MGWGILRRSWARADGLVRRHEAVARAADPLHGQGEYGRPRLEHLHHGGAQPPDLELARRQMSAAGGMLSFVVEGGKPAAAQLMDSLKLVCHAVTFGTSRTICMHPATITHEHMTPEERAEAGIDDGLIRLSVGLEDAADIIADLEQALKEAHGS